MARNVLIILPLFLRQVCENFVVNRNEFLSVRLLGRILCYNFSVVLRRLRRIDFFYRLGEEIGIYIFDY